MVSPLKQDNGSQQAIKMALSFAVWISGRDYQPKCPEFKVEMPANEKSTDRTTQLKQPGQITTIAKAAQTTLATISVSDVQTT
jgi:hypothetical protein